MIGSTEIVNTSYDRDSLTITGDMNEGTLPINNEDDILNNAGIASTDTIATLNGACLLYTSPSPRDQRGSRMPSSA